MITLVGKKGVMPVVELEYCCSETQLMKGVQGVWPATPHCRQAAAARAAGATCGARAASATCRRGEPEVRTPAIGAAGTTSATG